MKTIGLLGGMSWESTVTYYQQINEAVKARLGGLHSAKIVLHSVDFHEIEVLQRQGDWAAAGNALAEAGRSLQAAGADFLIICTNTMHKVLPAIAAAIVFSDKTSLTSPVTKCTCQGWKLHHDGTFCAA